MPSSPGGRAGDACETVSRAKSETVFQRTRSAADIAQDADASLAKIRALMAGLQEADAQFTRSLSSCQAVIDACGEAIASWFKGLRGTSLERAIREVLSPPLCSYAFVPVYPTGKRVPSANRF